MKKLLLFFNSLILTTCSTLGLSNLSQQTKISQINTNENEEAIKNEISPNTEMVLSIILENTLDNYTNPNISRIYSTPELKLITLNDVAKAIENKLFVLTEGWNFEVKILNEEIEILTESINKKMNATVKLVDTNSKERTFNLVINLEQSSDLQQLIAIRYLLEKPNFLKTFLTWHPMLENKKLARKTLSELHLQWENDYLLPLARIITTQALPAFGLEESCLEIPGLEKPSLLLQNFSVSPVLERRNLLHEKWYYNLLKSIENILDVQNFLADLYIKEFNNYNEVITYINNKFEKSIWTKDMKVSWNKRFVPNNFFSINSNTYTMHNPFIKHIPILNFINLDLKLKDIIAVKVTLLNLQSKHKIGNDFGNNFAVLSAFNETLSFLSFKYINTLKTQQECVKVLNAFIFKGMHHWNNENPAGWITELLTDLSSNSNLSSLEIREILLTKLCNDEISKNFILLRNNDENSNLVET